MKLFIGDFETSTGNDDGSTNVYLWGFSNLEKTIRPAGVNLHSLFTSILEHKVRELWFHNLSWDGKFILHYLLENGYTPMKVKTPRELKDKSFKTLYDDRNTIYNITVKFDNGHIVNFGDTLKILIMGVASLGEKLGIPKLEIEYGKYKHFNSLEEVPAEVLEYLWRDIDIIVDVYNKFHEQFPHHSITSAGTAMKDFKLKYGEKRWLKDFGGWDRRNRVWKNVLTQEMWDEFKKGYHGGWTFINKMFGSEVIQCNGYSYDVNSEYPAVMRLLLPYGKPLSYQPLGNSMCIYKIHIYHTRMKQKDMIPHLHIPSAFKCATEKYYEECKDTTVIYTETELNELKKTYHLVEGRNYDVLDKWYFKTKYIFREWVDDMYKQRKDAKISGDKIAELYIKLILNALYGKTGQNYKRENTIFVKDETNTKPGTRYGKQDEWVEDKEVEISEGLSYIPLALTIASYARCIMIRGVRANRKHIIYGDTDSMYLTKEAVGIPISFTELGSWKPELRFNKFRTLKTKNYLADVTHIMTNKGWIEKPHTKRAIAGLNKERHSLIDWDNYKSGTVIEGGNKQKRNVKGGVVLKDIKYTL